MRLFGVVAVCAVFVAMECACGSGGEPSSPADGSVDGPMADGLTTDGLTTDGPVGDGLPGDAAIADGPDAEGSVADGSVFDGTTPDGFPADGPPIDATNDAPIVMSGCDNNALLAGCVAGQCMVSTSGMPLPVGATITVTQKPVPADLSGDTLGSVLCSIALPAEIGRAHV